MNAFDFGNDCIQPNPENRTFFGSEDCLYLNIYVPSKCSTTPGGKLPVMFYIVGGGYAFGTGRFLGPDFLIETNVILVCARTSDKIIMISIKFSMNEWFFLIFKVTFNYRVGPHGFLNLALPEYSGNMGMKDQVLALKWVSENIEQFGGDRNQITVFGHSAGKNSIFNNNNQKYFRIICLHRCGICRCTNGFITSE